MARQTVQHPQAGLTIETGPLLAGLRECGLGTMTARDVTQFDSLVADFLERYGSTLEMPDDRGNGKSTPEDAYWEKYLRIRTALPKGSLTNTISFSVDVDELGFGLPRDTRTPCRVAAMMVLVLMSLYRDCRSAVPDRTRDDANLIRSAVATCRLPGIECDTISTCDTVGHWCVIAGGALFRLDLPRTLDAAAFPELVRAFEHIKAQAADQPPNLLPAMTAIDRPDAARLRDLLLEDDAARGTIEAMESAGGIIVLDDIHNDTPGDPDGVDFQRRMLIGSGWDRWYGKTTLVVSNGEWLGWQLDHGCFNGARAERLVDLVLERSCSLGVPDGNCHRPDRACGISVRSLEIPVRQKSFEPVLKAFRSTGQIETTFTYHGTVLSLPGMTRPELSECLIIATQLALALRRESVPDVFIPVRRVGADGDMLDYVRATFLSVHQLVEHYRITRDLDCGMVQRARADWRRWFRRGITGKAIENKMGAFIQGTKTLGIRHPLLEHDLVAARSGFPAVCISMMPARKTVGAVIYSFLPVAPGELAVAAYIGAGQLRFDLTSSTDTASELVGEISELLEQLARLRKQPAGPLQG